MDRTGERQGGPRLVVLICLLFMLGPLAIEFSLPALPSIQKAIGREDLRAELTITALLLGSATGKFFVGSVADAYGRKTPIVVCLAVFGLGAAAGALAPSVPVLAVARFVQALGLSAGLVMANSVIADVFDSRRMARVYSTAVVTAACTTVAASFLGGHLLDLFGWRSLFLVMASAAGLILAYVLLFIEETQPVERRSRAGMRPMLRVYRDLLRTPVFLSAVVIAGSGAASQFAYHTGGPAALIEQYDLKPSTGGAFIAAIALSLAVGSHANGWLLRRFTPVQILSVSLPALLSAGMLCLTAAITGAGGVYGIWLSLQLIIATLGFIVPNAMAIGLGAAGDRSGGAAALLGLAMWAVGTVCSAVIGASGDRTGAVMAMVICAGAAAGLLQFFRLGRQVAARPV